MLKQQAYSLERLIKQINECGVNFNICSDKSGNQQYTSLTGNDFKRLCASLPHKLFFIINNDTHDDVVFLWKELNEIHEYVIQTVSALIHSETAFNRVKHRVCTFLNLEQKGRLVYGRITPSVSCTKLHKTIWDSEEL